MTIEPGDPEPTIADEPAPADAEDFATVAITGAADGATFESGVLATRPRVPGVGTPPPEPDRLDGAVDDPGGTADDGAPMTIAAPATFETAAPHTDATARGAPPGYDHTDADADAGSPPVAFDQTEAATGLGGGDGADRPGETDFATLAVTGFTPHPGRAEAPRAPAEAFCGRYLLKTFYARGGMGEVWLAEDPAIGRPVALKRILGDRPDQRRRFRVEAQITGRLEHPGVVPVHELGVAAGGEPFYTMKFVQGRTLKRVVEDFHAAGLTGGARELEQVRLLQMFHSLCQTVAYAHSRGVLHRDLKPENVMLGPYGETVLLDWGIAKVIGQPDDDAGTGARAAWVGDALPDTGTHFGAVLGTPSYMAPEVAAGLSDEVDERSDIYLLGGTLYEILSGNKPRSARTVVELLKKAQHEPPKPVRAVNPLVPKALEAVCLKAMAHRKDDRYQTAAELAEDVQRFLAGEPVSAYREDALTRAWRWAQRHRSALGRSAAALLIGGLTLLAVTKVRDAERRRTEAAALADRLKAEDRARREVAEFRRLADEAAFFAATTEPVSEHAPYYDPRKGQTAAADAAAIAARWGPALERLPLPPERPALKTSLHDLTVLTAHMQALDPGPDGARRVLATLDRADRLAPPTAGVYRLRASALERLGDRGKADALRQQADDPHTPTTAQDLFLAGERDRVDAATRVGGPTDRKPWEYDPARTEQAIARYREALALDPDHFWARLQLGRCYQSLGRFAEATEALGACIAIRPEAVWGYTARALALAQQGRYAEAEHDLNRAARLDPDDRTVRLHRGVVSWRQQRNDAALADFAAALAPPDARRLVEAAYYRGQLYADLNEGDKALADFDRVAAASPGFRSVYLDRSLVLIAQGEPARALADLDTYARLSRRAAPEGWEVHGLRGRLLRFLYTELPLGKRRADLGRALLPLASAELLKAVKLGAKAPGVFDDLGAVMEHSGRVDLAVSAYTRGIALAPDDPKLLIKRAWAYEQTDRRDQAAADFAAAARSDPESAEAHTGLGYVQALRALPPDAQREADLALLHGGDNYLVLHNVACIYATLGQTDGPQSAPSQDAALALLRRSVRLWKAKGASPSELDLMKGEPAFKPLRGRKDFQDLLRDGEPTARTP